MQSYSDEVSGGECPPAQDELTAETALSAPDAGGGKSLSSIMKLNHAGYPAAAPKFFIMEEPPAGKLQLQTIDESTRWKNVREITLVREQDHWIGDFSAVTSPGDYRIIAPGTDVPPEGNTIPFVIRDGVYDHAARLVAEFFRWQRCGHPDGWAGMCHQDPVPLVGTGRTLDVRGGYHQSGDLRCWADGISNALYGYLRFAEKREHSGGQTIFAEEIRWGCDYFLKIIAPEGFVYDCQFVPIGWGPRDYYNSPVNLGAHYNISRLLARAAIYFRTRGDNAYADRLVAAAEQVFEFAATAPVFDTPYLPPVKTLPPGTQGAGFYFQTCLNSTVDFAGRCAAALDLYLATGQAAYRQSALEAGRNLAGLQITDGPLTGAFRVDALSSDLGFADCSYGYTTSGPMVFLDLLETFPDRPDSELWRETIKRYAGLLLELHETVGFQYQPRLQRIAADKSDIHPIWRPEAGEDVRLQTSQYAILILNDALLLLRTEKLLGGCDGRIRQTAQRGVDYIFGANPQGASYVTGIGYGQLPLPVYGQFFPSTPQLPGGVVFDLKGEYDLPAGGMLLWTLAELPGGVSVP